MGKKNVRTNLQYILYYREKQGGKVLLEINDLDFTQDIPIIVAHKHKSIKKTMFYNEEVPKDVTLLPVIPVNGKINPSPEEIQQYFQGKNKLKRNQPKVEEVGYIPPYATSTSQPQGEKEKKKRFFFRKKD